MIPWLLGACALQDVEVPLPGDGQTGLILLVHGGGDDPSVWAQDLVDPMTDVLDDPSAWIVHPVDWTDDASGRVRAASRGRRIGEELAETVDAYERVHLVAHSVGAHLAHGVATTTTADVQLTLLDPFVGSGLVRWGYGRDRFGEGALWAEAYVNTDDGVPSTDGELDLVHVFDVTREAGSVDREEGHRWPIVFYADSVGSGVGLDLAMGVTADRSGYPVGERTVLDP